MSNTYHHYELHHLYDDDNEGIACVWLIMINTFDWLFFLFFLSSSAEQWLQFDLGPPRQVTGIITRGYGGGVEDLGEHPPAYKLYVYCSHPKAVPIYYFL